MSDSRNKRKLYYRTMTVANIRREEESDFVVVLFLESARFYRLLKKNRDYRIILQKIENALSDTEPLTVGFESIESDIIEEVK
jgi:hypothetical protein